MLPDTDPDGVADVTIRVLPPRREPISESGKLEYDVQPGQFRLAIPEVAEYRVEAGERITVEPAEAADEGKVRLFLLGSTMGALLYQRGLFPLHGSAVETPWGAMIFVGAQGAGKSTLAAEFHRLGYRLLSDDVCAVQQIAEGLQILPALAQFRLCPDAYERIGTPSDSHFNVDKFVVPMGEGYRTEPLPLCAIHILSDQEEEQPAFSVLRGFDRIQRLMENLYRPQYLQGQQTATEQMRLAGQIAQHATLVSVTRRRDVTALEGLVRFLEAQWTERFPLISQEEQK